LPGGYVSDIGTLRGCNHPRLAIGLAGRNDECCRVCLGIARHPDETPAKLNPGAWPAFVRSKGGQAPPCVPPIKGLT
jgi:hypothetical protein